jgi:phosphoglucomutase/phosphomannomutase
VTHGYHVEGAASKTCPGAQGAEQTAFLLDRFRNEPPAELGGVRLRQVNDYERHEVRSLPANEKIRSLPSPEGPLLLFDAADEGFAFAIRPSGTEPKIKFYLFGYAAVGTGKELAAVKKATDARLDGLRQALLENVEAALAEFATKAS